jgi:sugar (pentulose or hexulose) kinase
VAADRRVVIGVDAGTTSAKAVVVDSHGREVAAGRSDPIRTDTNAPGGSEQAPDEIWDAVVTAVRRAVAEASESVEVVTMAVAAQSGSVVPIDGDGVPGRAVTWMDTRSRPLVDSWPLVQQERIRAISGWSAATGLGLATISWLQDAESGRSDAQRWASVDDLLVHRLVGEWITNPSNAVGMQVMDVVRLEWSDELCGWCGIDATQLSRIAPSGADAGVIDPTAASLMGISPGARLIIGGHDQACAALGLGAIEPGAIVLSAGTAWVLSIITGRVLVDEIPAAFNLSPHVVPSCWSASRYLGGLGAAIGSVLESAGPVDELEQVLVTDEPHADQPYFAPEIHSAGRTEWGRFTGPTEPRRPADRVRAVFEACAFEVRAAVEEGDVGPADDPIVFVGGGSRSTALARIIADVLQRDLAVHADASWPALGAARLAGAALGWPSPAAAGDSTRVAARADRRATYDQRYRTYRDLMTGDLR